VHARIHPEFQQLSGSFIPSSKLYTAEALVPQVGPLTWYIRSSDFALELRKLCDPVLYAYLSKVANTAEKRHYLHVSCTAVAKHGLYLREGVDAFLGDLHVVKALDLYLSVYQPYDLRVLFATLSNRCRLWNYFKSFRSDPERSREFYYEGGLWHAFVATRYMRFLRTLSDSR